MPKNSHQKKFYSKKISPQKNLPNKIFTQKVFTQKVFTLKISRKTNFRPKNFHPKKFSPDFFSNIILKYSIVRVSFVDLRWAQLYVSLVVCWIYFCDFILKFFECLWFHLNAVQSHSSLLMVVQVQSSHFYSSAYSITFGNSTPMLLHSFFFVQPFVLANLAPSLHLGHGVTLSYTFLCDFCKG